MLPRIVTLAWRMCRGVTCKPRGSFFDCRDGGSTAELERCSVSFCRSLQADLNRAASTVQAYASRMWSLLNEAYKDLIAGDSLNLKLLSLAPDEANTLAASALTHAGAPSTASGFPLRPAVLNLPLKSVQLERWFDFVNIDKDTGASLPADEQLSRSSIYSMINAVNYLHDVHKTRVDAAAEVLFAQVKRHTQKRRLGGHGGAYPFMLQTWARTVRRSSKTNAG